MIVGCTSDELVTIRWMRNLKGETEPVMLCALCLDEDGYYSTGEMPVELCDCDEDEGRYDPGCRWCDGTGKLPPEPCEHCWGAGYGTAEYCDGRE